MNLFDGAVCIRVMKNEHYGDDGPEEDVEPDVGDAEFFAGLLDLSPNRTSIKFK